MLTGTVLSISGCLTVPACARLCSPVLEQVLERVLEQGRWNRVS